MYINDRDNDALLNQLLYNAGEHLPDEQLSPIKARKILKKTIAGTEASSARTIVSAKNLPALLWLAASVLLVAGLSFLFLSHYTQAAGDIKITYSKPVNDHQLIRLSDGTTVTLNKNSRIEYPEAFNGLTREVTLVGEGYFDVKHDGHKPFLVHVGKLTVTVLGTAFNINANSIKNNIAVTVTRGKVSVSDQHKVLGTLVRNQQISVNTKSLVSKQLVVNAGQVIQWQSDDLFFDDVTMAAAMKTLENRFNTKIDFDNEHIRHCTLTGAFTHHESLQQILKVLCSFNNATYLIKPDHEVIISGPGC